MMCTDDALNQLDEHWEDFNSSLMFFLPKKFTGSTETGGGICELDNVRPLSVTNADNRILANAVRSLLEPFVGPEVTAEQRGFIGGRSMVANIVDIEESMLQQAISSERGGAVFFDFAAAFPSVEQEMMHVIFQALGWPRWLLSFLRCLYHNNRCLMVVGGLRFMGFPTTRGIRQGCPLSPLLFAVSSDLLLRRLARMVPEAIRRAYADDLAIVHADIMSQLGRLQDTFSEYERLSGLRLNVRKTVFVPLFQFDTLALRSRLHAVAPLWGQLCIAEKAKYLGVYLGFDSSAATWATPLTKYADRAKQWAAMGLGLQNTVDAYKTYIASVLMFVAQLTPVPEVFDGAEWGAVKKLFPGPTGWVTPAAMKELKEVFPTELMDVRLAACAAQARVARLEAARHGGLHVDARASALRARQGVPGNAVHASRVSAWLDSSILVTLAASQHKVLHLERSIPGGCSLAAPSVDVDFVGFCKGWQARAYGALRRRRQGDLRRHARRRLDRWSIEVPPGRRVDRFINGAAAGRIFLPPRVMAAGIRAAFNAWPTCRRFQQVGRCVLNCGAGQDSIEHYAHCRVYHDLSWRLLRLPRPAPAAALSTFLGLCGEAPQQASLRSMARYALYRTLNGSRYGCFRPADAEDAFRGYLREASAGHAPAMRLIATTWASTSTSS